MLSNKLCLVVFLFGLTATVTGCGHMTARSPQATRAAETGNFVTRADVAPASAGAVSITAFVTSDSSRTVLVDVEVYDSNSARAFQQFFDDQTLRAGVTQSYSVTWQMPATAPSGSYRVKIGVFSPGWGTLYHWNDNAGAIPAAAAAPPPAEASPEARPPLVGASAPSGLPSLPHGWPATLQLGMADEPGGAAAMKATARFGFRYQYLAGGVNTGKGWATWNPDGSFVTSYIQESLQNEMIPVFTYYMLLQSQPGTKGAEADAVYSNLQNTDTMRAYYEDLDLFFQRAGSFPSNPVVLHVEPDLWGYLEKRARGDEAATVPAKVAATGLPELAGLPDNLVGFTGAIARLRQTYAPNVLLGYHLSVWGTGTDILYAKPADVAVVGLAKRASNYFRSLGGSFELVFAEFSDRDAAFKQYVDHDRGASWWSADDYRRNLLFLSTFVNLAQKRVVMWQIPYGNTKLRTLNNTWDHYQDNHVEWLLDDPSRAHLNDYAGAGVLAFLFGRGADGATCACDAAKDGVTNPEPINGNLGLSLSDDDDGGFFRLKAAAYYAAGALPLP